MIGEASGFFELDDAAVNSVFANIVEIDAAAIVADLDDDLSALMIGVERNGATSGLSSAKALVGGLDAVINGVADEVSERLGERVQDAFVEVGVFSGNFESDVLSAELGDIAHDARKAAEKLFDGNHADFENAFVQLVENTGLECERFGELAANGIAGVMDIEFGERPVEHGLADD